MKAELWTIEGRRLTLRPLADSDAQALFDAVEATRTLLKRRFRWVEAAAKPEAAPGFIRDSTAAAAAGRRLALGVFELKTGRLAGIAGLDHLLPAEAAKAELSVWIRADEQDKGYATESGRLLVEHAFKRMALHRLYSRIDPVNRAGRKVLQRLGFRYEGCLRDDRRLNGRWIDQECWGMLRSEWKK